jgi:ABC-2 type transport system permease protein
MKNDVLRQFLRFKIAIQTLKDNWKITLILTLLYMGMAVMYAGMYPAFKDIMADIAPGFMDTMSFIPGIQDMASYVGFLNAEMYQMFWMLILGIIIGFVAASLMSKEIEGKTIDMLMSNPVSRKQIVLEKYLGLIPMLLLINFATMLTIMGVTLAINEELNFIYLFLTHVVSIPYFLAVLGIGILISVIIDEKMKASIIMIAILVGMFVFRSISLMIPDYENLGLVTISHYFNPYDILKYGHVDIVGLIVLIIIAIWSLLASMIYFEHKDIQVT